MSDNLKFKKVMSGSYEAETFALDGENSDLARYEINRVAAGWQITYPGRIEADSQAPTLAEAKEMTELFEASRVEQQRRQAK